MTLGEFKSMTFSHGAETSKIMVFSDEDSCDDYLAWKYDGDKESNGFFIDMMIESEMKLKAFLTKDWVNAEVQYYIPTAMNEVAVVVEHHFPYEGEKKDDK